MLTKTAHFVHRLEIKNKNGVLEAQQLSFQQPYMLSVQNACFSWTSRHENFTCRVSANTARLTGAGWSHSG